MGEPQNNHTEGKKLDEGLRSARSYIKSKEMQTTMPRSTSEIGVSHSVFLSDQWSKHHTACV